jgi:hypothetical protein
MFLYKGKTLEGWLPEAVERIVEGFHPLKVILFGSLARGEAGYHSDVDLLIVFDHVEWENKRELAVDIRPGHRWSAHTRGRYSHGRGRDRSPGPHRRYGAAPGVTRR